VFAYKKTVGMGVTAILASAAWALYWRRGQPAAVRGGRKTGVLTFNPMHRMVPTSPMVKGERMRSMTSTRSVGDPASSTEDPLNTVTLTSSPFRTAAPTSTSLSTGWPMSTAVESSFGTKRTSPDSGSALGLGFMAGVFLTFESHVCSVVAYRSGDKVRGFTLSTTRPDECSSWGACLNCRLFKSLSTAWRREALHRYPAQPVIAAVRDGSSLEFLFGV